MAVAARACAARGSFITHHKDDIETVMHDLCPTNTWRLQEADLSGFPAVRTDEDID